MFLHQAGRALGEQGFQIDAVNQVERVEHIAFRLRHFLSVLIAYQAVNIDLPKGYIAHELQAQHDHSRDPEKDNVEAGDEHRTRIKFFE